MSQATLKGFPAEQADLEVAVPPFDYNPSAWRQRVPICILACVAFLMATHMALFQWQLIEAPWDPVFGEQTRNVLTSDVALRMHHWFGVPDAALGALAYLGDAIFGLAGSTRRWQYRPWLVILFGIDVIPLGIVSAILVVCQATIVGNWCLLCLITAVISLILVVMAYDEVYASLKLLYRVWQRTHDRQILWKVLWGRPTEIADEVACEMVHTT
ncbi:Vitamin K epoxide reductase family protein [Gimesia panareensis]|uniref:Vitamin K epoxide reductase family protein n=1 Tax=Gimesia panareensis TaxID=2527978 RepID=A0A518FTC2_9PLAN|nr:vitamin K epoxide reductase family protein [Gimesia panareensis]QDV19592.1 Vitamin K epoxide reductase family protein [Gimesia panareensis]